MTSGMDEDSLRALARVAYADMLHDHERHVKYEEAIVKTVKKFIEKNPGKEVKVLDIGSGTGLLSMMAARIGKDVSVTCIEAEKAVAEASVSIIKANGLEDQIKVINIRGEEYRTEEKGDILISELFDTELIGEGCLLVYHSALKYAMNNKPSCIPFKARIIIQPVKSAFLSQHNDFTDQSIEVKGRRGKIVFPNKECIGSGILHDLQANQLELGRDLTLLSDPQVAFEFDFTRLEGLKLKEEKILKFQVKTATKDTCLLFYWELVMDEEETIILSTKPSFEKLEDNWREHWIQAVYYCGSPVEGETCLEINASHDEYSFEFLVNNNQVNHCTCGLHSHISRSRMSLLNDSKHWSALLSHVPVTSSFKYFGDSSLLPVWCASFNRSARVECVTPDCKVKLFFDKFGEINGLDNLCVVKEPPQQVPQEDYFVLIEPFLSCQESSLDSLVKLWSLIPSSIPDDRILINRVVIRVMPVSLTHLWKTRTTVDQVCGFNIKPFSDVINSAMQVDSLVEYYPLSEYHYKCCDTTVIAFDVERRALLQKSCFEFSHSFDNLKNSNEVAFVFFLDFYHSQDFIYSTEAHKQQNQLISWSQKGEEVKISAVFSASASPALTVLRRAAIKETL